MTLRTVTAEAISCPGKLGDAHYTALQINIDGLASPYVLTLAMPAIGFRALSQQVDPEDLYHALALAISAAGIKVNVRRRGESARNLVAREAA